MPKEKKSLEEIEKELNDNVVESDKAPNDNIEKNKDNKHKNSKKIILLIILIILILIIVLAIIFKDKIFTNNSENTEPNNSLNEPEKTEPINEISSNYKMTENGLQDIDLKFLQLEMNNQNMVYSPLSIKFALGMLNEGTGGNSATEISDLLGTYEFHKYTNNNNMSFANAMFIRNSFKNSINLDYIDNLKSKYNAEVIYDDFTSPKNINNWVSNNTFNLVDNLVEDVSNTDFFLVNALAIDMEWKQRIQATVGHFEDHYSVDYKHERYSDSVRLRGSEGFDVIRFNNQNTVDSSTIGASINNYDIVNDKGRENIKQFITKEYQNWLDTNTCNHPYDPPAEEFVENYIKELDSNYKDIKVSTDFRFYIDDNIKVFAKDLKKSNNTNLEYIGIMPIKTSLNDYVKNTNAEELNKIINNIKDVKLENFEEGKITRITGGIPLFKYEYQLNLINDLKRIGINDVFDSQKADLSGLTNESGVHINQVVHKANIEFSNDGIKAAAATSEGGMGCSDCSFDYRYEVPVVTIDLTFDKPFLYLIRDKNTKEVWFVGSVYAPTIRTENIISITNED